MASCTSGLPMGTSMPFNSITGALVWKSRTGGISSSSPAVANGVVYVGSDGGDGFDGASLFALNASTGALLWDYGIASGVRSTPAVANGMVYVTNNAVLDTFDATTGAHLWQFEAEGPVGNSPAVANGVVYFGSFNSGEVYALNASTGALLWQYAHRGLYIFSGGSEWRGIYWVA